MTAPSLTVQSQAAIQQAFGTSSVTSGFSVASMLLGCAVGAFFAGNVADRLGRKPVMFFTGLQFLISAFGSGIASGAFEFIIYRLLGGFAVGAASVFAPTHTFSEIAPARIRGRLALSATARYCCGYFFQLFSSITLSLKLQEAPHCLFFWASPPGPGCSGVK
jgi:SP family sugar:H+ symporter-like MFS transporter